MSKDATIITARRVFATAGLVLGVCVAPACALEPATDVGNEEAADEAIGEADEAVTCNPIVSRYPVAGPHNNGYDINWSTQTCNGSYSNSDYSASHLGNDIFAARGTPVVAAQSGKISWNFWNSAGGNVVYIVDGCGWWHYYAHLDTIDPALYIGKTVMVGTRLGTVGNTGSAYNTAPHLHYSVYPGDYNSGIDPYPYIHAVEGGACQSGNPCSCLSGINVDNYPVPVTDTDCGHRVCGLSSELWECGGNQAWNKIGGVGSCSSTCSCPGGKFENGREIPEHMTHCGYRVCGMSHTFWDCTNGGWVNTNQGC